MPDKAKAKGELKDQIFALLTNDKDLLSTIVDAVTTCLIEKLLESKEVISNIASAILTSDEFKASLTSEQQEIYEGINHDLEKSKDHVSALEEQCNGLRSTVDILKDEVDSLEQYSRRNCLLIHGIKEDLDESGSTATDRNENTDDITIKFFQDHLNLNINEWDIERSHRLGRLKPDRPRPIIVKFTRYNTRSEVFRAKRLLKGTGFVITESLTPQRLGLLNEAKSNPNVSTTWTSDGKIICLLNDRKTKISITKRSDFTLLTQKVPRRSARPR